MKNLWQRFRSTPTWVQVVVWVFLGIVVLGPLVGGTEEDEAGNGDDIAVDATDTTEADDTPTTEAAAETTAPTAPPTTEAPTTTAAPAKQWVEVARMEGNGQKRSEPFTITSRNARLRYEFPEGGFFAVYLVEEGDSLQESGGFPEATCTDPCADQTQLAKPPGSYYFDVSASGPFVVVVEEMR